MVVTAGHAISTDPSTSQTPLLRLPRKDNGGACCTLASDRTIPLRGGEAARPPYTGPDATIFSVL
jgi:hypothetical protein